MSDIYKSFGEKKVLTGVNISTESGKAVGLLGRNGAGKTTTIRILMNVFPPDKGTVKIDGKPIDFGKIKFGYLPEEHGLYPKIEIHRQLVYLCELRGMKAKDAKVSIDKWMKRLELQEYTHKRLETLSKGNQQKIQLVAALLTNPDIIVLDEPFSGLDPVNAALLKDVVKEVINDGKIVLFSSHQMGYVEEFCDNIAILNDGEIVLSGEISKIKRSYNRSVIAVKSLDNEKIAAVCKSELNEMVQETEKRKNILLVTLKNERLKLPFAEALSSRNIDYDNFSVYEPTLEEIFVEYTADKASEGEANAV